MKLQRGFTLIEVLVASMILFAVVSSMSLLYQSTLKAENNATKSILEASSIPFILDTIQYSLRNEGVYSGEGHYQGVSYRWLAELKSSSKGYVPEGLESEYGNQIERFRLWNVSLIITDRPPIEFMEVTW